MGTGEKLWWCGEPVTLLSKGGWVTTDKEWGGICRSFPSLYMPVYMLVYMCMCAPVRSLIKPYRSYCSCIIAPGVTCSHMSHTHVGSFVFCCYGSVVCICLFNPTIPSTHPPSCCHDVTPLCFFPLYPSHHATPTSYLQN